MIDFNEDPEKFINRFSLEMENTFLEMFQTKFGHANFVSVNWAYNEYVKDSHNVHMNATRWANLTEFINYLQENGRIETKME